MSSRPDRPVVVGVDGSPSDSTAVRWAARHASRAKLPLRIIHAFGWPLVHVRSAPSGWIRVLRSEAWSFVDDARRQAYEVDPDLEISADVPTNFSAPQLLRESKNASLVVVGSHGLGGFGSLLIGSTGVELAARAAAPVVVARGRREAEVDRTAPILVGYDGSPASDLAVAAAFDYAEVHRRPVHLLHVSPFGGGPAHVTERMVDLAAAWRLVHRDVEVTSREVNGHPAGTLTEASRDAALVVVGSRGRGGFRGLALGSVSQALLHHAHCPVMVLPPALLVHPKKIEQVEPMTVTPPVKSTSG